jgi:FecR protein
MGSSLYAQIQRHDWNGVILKEISPTVSVIREGASLPMFKWGMTLYEKDEIRTGENGKASIRFSSEEKGNEVILGPSTSVRVSRIATKYDHSVYRINVIQGKIWAKDRPSQSRKVQVNAGANKIVPFGGEYVVQQTDKQTLAANTKGKVRILDRSTNRYLPLPPGEIASVSKATGELIITWVPEKLMNEFSSLTMDPGKSAAAISTVVATLKEEANKIVIPDPPKPEELEPGKEKAVPAIGKKSIAIVPKKRIPEPPVLKPKPAKPIIAQPVVPIQKKIAVTAPVKPAPMVGKRVSKAIKPAENPVKQATEAPKQVKKQPTPATITKKKVENGQKTGKTETVQKSKKPDSKPTKGTQIAHKRDQKIEKDEESTPEVKKSAEPKKQIITAPPEPVEEEPLWMTYKWDIATGSAFLAFTWISMDNASNFDSLESKNDTLKSQWATATTSSERNALEVDYEVNKEKMASYQENVTLYNNLSILAICLEGYLLYKHIFDSDTKGHADGSQPSRYGNGMNPDKIAFGFSDPGPPSNVRLQLSWKW